MSEAQEPHAYVYWDSHRSDQTRKTTGVGFTIIRGQIEAQVEVLLGLSLSREPTVDEFRQTLRNLSAALLDVADAPSQIFRHPHRK